MTNQPATRPDTLIHFARLYMEETGKTVADFSYDLINSYLQLVPEESQTIDSLKLIDDEETAEGYLRVKDSTRRAVDRYLNGTVQIPALLEEAWVAALPPKYRIRCECELIRRYGKVVIELAEELDRNIVLNAARLMKESADALEALAPIIADSKIDENDRPYIKKAGDELADLLEISAGLLNLLYERFPEEFPAFRFRQVIEDDQQQLCLPEVKNP